MEKLTVNQLVRDFIIKRYFTVKTSLLPWFVIALLLTGLGGTAPISGLDKASVCLKNRLNLESRAADVLFVGSSAIANAVDPIFIETTLSSILNRDVDVEKLADLGFSPFKFLLLLETYIERRGQSPQVLVMHMPVPSKFVKDGYSPIYDIKTMKTYDLDTLRAMRDKINAVEDDNIRTLDKNWLSDQELLFFKLKDRIINVFSWPKHIFGLAKRCNNEHLIHNRERVPDGRLELGRDYSSADLVIGMTPSQRLKAELNNQEAFSIDLSNPKNWRQYHSDLFITLNLIEEFFGDQIPHIYFTFVPHFGVEAFSPNISEVISQNLKVSTYIDSIALFEQQEAKVYAQNAFRDQNHLNYNGAHLFGLFWARHLTKDLQ